MRTTQRKRIPLTDLARSYEEVHCPDGMVPVKDKVMDPGTVWEAGDGNSNQTRKIPRIVHMTAMSRCMTPEFAENIEQWKFEGYSLFLHDEDAIDRLLQTFFYEFPWLQQVQRCLSVQGAAKTDIWRALVIYEYGGIYSDMVRSNGDSRLVLHPLRFGS